MTTSRIATILLTLASPLAAQAKAPYAVQGHHITSQMQAGVVLTADSALTYVGSQRFTLYGVAQAEQHLFAQSRDGKVVRFLWVQFEEYLPSSNATYDYSSSPVVTASGRPFHADKELWHPPTVESRPGSDGAMARAMLRAHGLTLAPAMLYERMVWLPDPANRRELMVIFAEDQTLTGAAAADSAFQGRAIRSFSVR